MEGKYHGNKHSCYRDSQFRSKEGRDSSSVSPSFGGGEVSRNAPVCGVERRVTSSGLPVLTSAMVAIDHGPVGSAAAFFKESMRCAAMTGTKIGCNLCMGHKRISVAQRSFRHKKKKLTPQGRAESRPPEHTHMVSKNKINYPRTYRIPPTVPKIKKNCCNS